MNLSLTTDSPKSDPRPRSHHFENEDSVGEMRRNTKEGSCLCDVSGPIFLCAGR